MTPEAQRIAIAESVGLLSIDCTAPFCWDILSGPNKGLLTMPTPSLLPDFVSDLNAMHEVEKTFTKTEYEVYTTHLTKIVQPKGSKHYSWWQVLHATASQRAEAYLRTINKWSDDQ